jgi:hypothetical protein
MATWFTGPAASQTLPFFKRDCHLEKTARVDWDSCTTKSSCASILLGARRPGLYELYPIPAAACRVCRV